MAELTEEMKKEIESQDSHDVLDVAEVEVVEYGDR